MSEKTRKRNPKAPRQALPVLPIAERVKSSAEVALGFELEQAVIEARRCLDCKDPKCIAACPLNIDIKEFIRPMVDGDFSAAFEVLSKHTPFPGVCGRVCQHELF